MYEYRPLLCIYTSKILNFSYVFWFGDLNFRLTGDDKPESIESMIEENRFDELIERDELSLIRRQRRAFTELDEQLPQFPPTFKFKTGTTDYDLKYELCLDKTKVVRVNLLSFLGKLTFYLVNCIYLHFIETQIDGVQHGVIEFYIKLLKTNGKCIRVYLPSKLLIAVIHHIR